MQFLSQKPEKIERKISAPKKDAEDLLNNMSISQFFKPQSEVKSGKPARRLKGLDSSSIKVLNFSDLSDSDTDTLVTRPPTKIPQKKVFVKSNSTETPPMSGRIQSVENINNTCLTETFRRSNSLGSSEMALSSLNEIRGTRDCTPPLNNFKGSEVARRCQRMLDIIADHKTGRGRRDAVKSERSPSIGTPEMAVRRQKVAELIDGPARRSTSPEIYIPKRRNSTEITRKMQIITDIFQTQKKTKEPRKCTGRRKAAREITRQRFEKSMQMLAAESSFTLTSSADLDNDYGLQQYRASAPQFDERVKKLERQLQHFVRGLLLWT